MPTIEANGIKIYFETHGEGEPLLLICGLANDITQIERLIQGLSKDRKVISFDNRGVGRTDKPDMPYTMEMMGEDAASLLKGLAIERADILGISMGGRIAISLALARPDMVGRLILVSTSARVPRRRGLSWSLGNLLVRIPSIRAVGTKYPQPYYAYVRQRDASKGFDATSRLHEIHAPTLILQGNKDRIVPYQLAEEMRAGIQNSDLVAFNGGHLSIFSKSEEIIEKIDGFLKSHRAG